ncbi:helix-turn-helix transcriptional regulator [Olivibacter sp. SDN3]|uniref:helix-turn-helix domain-containing protein n=1 Tax=Olivibacter sp. SDN3 TaxID=2764720 RepID=UPI0016511902|nr:helix-turn-helix transcriptional regulator [Olivibacter sp. SDN3]QNL49595.1 helix-turn-helix transcriptional regulator [Olivibacter sp. SDN3]
MTSNDLLKFIKRQRKAKGLSQAEMAKRMNIVLKTYQNIESGITRIDIDRLKQIASLIDLNLSYVFRDEQGTAEKSNEEKALYHKIITDKELYIAKLEEDIRFYQEILRENRSF